jgi:DNA (cytosine-5)-methyltransferase 1
LAGWKGLFAVERNPAAFSTLKANLVDQRGHFAWPDWLAVSHWDIKTLLARKSAELAKLKGSVDLVVGGSQRLPPHRHCGHRDRCGRSW